MKRILLFFVISFFYLYAHCQKVRMEGNKYRFLCKADSLEYYSIKELIESGVDSILLFHYDYDNGRVENAIHYFLWIDNGSGNLKTIKGCDKVSIGELDQSISIKPLFDYYIENRIDTIKTPINSDQWQSHDMGYYISAFFPGKTTYFNIRNYNRNISDVRVIWVDLFEKIVK